MLLHTVAVRPYAPAQAEGCMAAPRLSESPRQTKRETISASAPRLNFQLSSESGVSSSSSHDAHASAALTAGDGAGLVCTAGGGALSGVSLGLGAGDAAVGASPGGVASAGGGVAGVVESG